MTLIRTLSRVLKFHPGARTIQTLKVGASHHNLKNVNFKTEKKKSVCGMKINLQIQLAHIN